MVSSSLSDVSLNGGDRVLEQDGSRGAGQLRSKQGDGFVQEEELVELTASE